MSADPPAFVVRRSTLHGRGVFAARSITAGEVLERSPVLLLPVQDGGVDLRRHRLADYVFAWEPGQTFALPLGASLLLNHATASSANVIVVFEFDGPTASLVAREDLNVGAELLLDYRGTMPGTPFASGTART